MKIFRVYGTAVVLLFLVLAPSARSCRDDRSASASTGAAAGGRSGGFFRTYHK